MKHYKKIWIILTIFIPIMSCTDYVREDFLVDMPESLASMQYLNNYDALKTYVNRTENPNFKLGAGAGLSDYTNQGVMYRLLNSNFDEITMGWEMKHGAIVQSDGSLSLSDTESLVEAAELAGMNVYGHTLCWHSNQNAIYLNGLIAPTIIPGSSSDGGYAFKIITVLGGGFWEVQSLYELSGIENGATYELKFMMRGDGAGQILPELQRGSDYSSNGFGWATVSSEWTEYSLTTTIDADDRNRFIISYGDYDGTLFIDNITLCKSGTATNLIVNGDFETGSANGWGGWGGTAVFSISADGEGYDPTGSSTSEIEYIGNTNFEKGNIDGWYGWGGDEIAPSLSALGEGRDGGYAIKLQNNSLRAFWEVQFAYTGFDYNTYLENNTMCKIGFWVRGEGEGVIQPEVQDRSTYAADGFGTITPTSEWTYYELTTMVTGDMRDHCLFSYGEYVGTLYIDDVSLTQTLQTGGKVIEKTEEEKAEIIDNALETFIAGMMEACKGYVKAWDVVNEPMSDWPDASQLKSGVGREDLADDEFYWQDYLGEYYAARAIELARKHYVENGGNTNDLILFINDYGLESDSQEKCKGLIAYVNKIEKDKGVKVDGIGTQLHVTCGETKIESIREMFKNLAATGKLIKVSELDMGYRPAANADNLKTADLTEDQHKEMASFYEEIVKSYFELIPASQRYGITHWSPLDSPESSSWRTNEPIGLWDLNYNRKHTFGGFANGLAGKDISTEN